MHKHLPDLGNNNVAKGTQNGLISKEFDAGKAGLCSSGLISVRPVA